MVEEVGGCHKSTPSEVPHSYVAYTLATRPSYALYRLVKGGSHSPLSHTNRGDRLKHVARLCTGPRGHTSLPMRLVGIDYATRTPTLPLV